MRIRVRDVVSGGIRVPFQIRAVDIGLENEEFIDPEHPIKIIADLKRINDFILARAAVTFMARGYCARCLERLSREVTMNYEIDLEIIPGDEWLDFGERIREEMFIAYLPRVLCREDCKGICPDCGVDLNSEKCECNKE